jgi:hypothetical protein
LRKSFAVIAAAAILSPITSLANANLGNILPLGDSITQGLNETGSTPGAWRSPFFQDSTAAGYSMQFVGTSNATPDSILTAAAQTAHDGWSGYEIDNDPVHGRNGIDELFNTTVVDNIPTPEHCDGDDRDK